MKILILAENPEDCGSLSIQANLLYRGLIENGIECQTCNYKNRRREREWLFKVFKPDIVIGVGWWAETPENVQNPQKFGLQPVPWFLADGWVANYHDILSSLPLAFTTSNWVKEVYERDGVDVKNFRVLPVGYDARRFKPIPKDHPGVLEIKKMLGLGNEKIILTIGGDVTSKGAQEMIQALAKIDKEYPNWKYVCKAINCKRSQEHHKEELELINKLNLDPKKIVYITDDLFRHDFMPYFLNSCDIYAAPSRLEGFGMLQVESMACGKPVISIDAMGPKDTIIHGKTGFLAKVGTTIDLEEEWVTKEMGYKENFRMKFDKPKTLAYRADPDNLAKCTLELLANDSLRETMGQQAAQHALDNFQYQHVAQKCVNILKSRFNLK